MKFKILPSDTLLPHFSIQEDELGKRMANFQGFQNTIQDFTFYTSSSVVYSSKIEGVEIELDSYLKHKLLGVKFLVDYTKKADDLFEAYSFARSRILNEKSILAAHKLITKNFLRASERGRWRVSPGWRKNIVRCHQSRTSEGGTCKIFCRFIIAFENRIKHSRDVFLCFVVTSHFPKYSPIE
jgi:hypothetical protein